MEKYKVQKRYCIKLHEFIKRKCVIKVNIFFCEHLKSRSNHAKELGYGQRCFYSIYMRTVNEVGILI